MCFFDYLHLSNVSDLNDESNVVDSSQKEAPETASVNESSGNRVFVKKYNKGKKKHKKVCLFCKRGILSINYKDTELLKNYVKRYNKILSSKISGNCIKHQHQLSISIKRARFVGLLPFVCP